MRRLPNPCVVDTNVAIVANGASEQADDDLTLECIEAIMTLTKRGGVVLDDDDRIVSEYRHKLSLAGQPGTGDMFLKWIHDNQWNEERCELRQVTCTDEDEQRFEEFPDCGELAAFDVSDRKFVAVANAGTTKAAILQAVDFKWWGWKGALEKCGIPVHFIDDAAAEAGFEAKMNK